MRLLRMFRVTKSLVILLVTSSLSFVASSNARDDASRQLVSENFVELGLHILNRTRAPYVGLETPQHCCVATDTNKQVEFDVIHMNC